MTALPPNLKPTKEQILAAVQHIENLNTAPHVLRHAIGLLADVNADMGKVVGLINTDAALAADIIRAANSAFYSSGERVASLDRAVEKLGFRESIRLLSMSIVHLLAARDLGCYGIPAEVYWAESLYHGIFVEELARETNAADPDTAHTAGLLRYIGRLAINQIIHDLGGGLFWDGSDPLNEWELREVGVCQSEVAAVLLRTWRFPEELAEAIEFQSDPARAAATNWYAGALHFAGQVLSEGQPPLTVSTTVSAVPQTEFVRHHRLDRERVEAVFARTTGRFTEISRTLYD